VLLLIAATALAALPTNGGAMGLSTFAVGATGAARMAVAAVSAAAQHPHPELACEPFSRYVRRLRGGQVRATLCAGLRSVADWRMREQVRAWRQWAEDAGFRIEDRHVLMRVAHTAGQRSRLQKAVLAALATDEVEAYLFVPPVSGPSGTDTNGAVLIAMGTMYRGTSSRP
jgi:hypothetical protein